MMIIVIVMQQEVAGLAREVAPMAWRQNRLLEESEAVRPQRKKAT